MGESYNGYVKEEDAGCAGKELGEAKKEPQLDFPRPNGWETRTEGAQPQAKWPMEVAPTPGSALARRTALWNDPSTHRDRLPSAERRTAQGVAVFVYSLS